MGGRPTPGPCSPRAHIARADAALPRRGRVRTTQGWSDRSFQAFEEGRLREQVRIRRIEELPTELASLEARRSELAEERSESLPSVPDPAELAELVGDIERALSEGALPERKAVKRVVVAEIRIRDRGHIQPVFRVRPWGHRTAWCPRGEPDERTDACRPRSFR